MLQDVIKMYSMSNGSTIFLGRFAEILTISPVFKCSKGPTDINSINQKGLPWEADDVITKELK